MKLDTRTKELIVIGASITANYQPCLQYHVSKALENQVNEDEIAEAIDIGRMVRRGAAYKMDKFAAMLGDAVPSSTAHENSECGCG